MMSSTTEYSVYKMLHYFENDNEYGCTRTRMTGNVGRLKSIDTPDNLKRRIVLLLFEELIDSIEKNSLGFVPYLCERKDTLGVLIILPENQKFSTHESEQFSRLEVFLSQTKLETPVFFIDRSDEIMGYYNDAKIERSFFNPFKQNLKINVPVFVEKEFKDFDIHNLYGRLSGSSGDGNVDRKTLAILTSFDTISLIPELGSGVSRDGGNVLAILEIAKMFRNLYDTVETVGELDIMFVFTGGNSFNFEGGRQFVQKGAGKNVDYVVNLDFMMSNELNIVVSKKIDDSQFKFLVSAFKDIATSMEIDFQVNLRKMKKKTNLYQHEVFQKQGIPSISISGREDKEMTGLIQSSITDRNFDIKLFKRNVLFLSKVLTTFVYKKPLKLVESELVDERFIRGWISAFRKYSRDTSYTTDNSRPNDKIIQGIKKALSKFVKIKQQTFKTKKQITFFGDVDKKKDSKLKIKVFYEPQFSVQILILLGVVIYLATMFVVIKGKETALKIFMNIWSLSKGKGKRN